MFCQRFVAANVWTEMQHGAHGAVTNGNVVPDQETSAQ